MSLSDILNLILSISAIVCAVALYYESMFRSLFLAYISNESLVSFYNKLEEGIIDFELFDEKVKSKATIKLQDNLDSFLSIMNVIASLHKRYFKSKLLKREAVVITNTCMKYITDRKNRWKNLYNVITKTSKQGNRRKH